MSEVITIAGGSTGAVADVDAHRLQTRPISDFEAAIDAGLAYSWSNLTFDPNANDTILGVENNSATHNLHIEKIIISGDTASQFVVFGTSGVTMAGTAVTGVNLNRSSGNVASATAKANETGQNQQGSTYPTRYYTVMVAANTPVVIDVGGSIILPNDHMIGIDYTTAATAANMTIIGYYKAI